MNYKLIFKTALLAGEIMLRNGAETYRVEDTMNRILHTTNFEVIESFVTPTGIFATLDDPSIEMITLVKRVDKRMNHLHKIIETNNVSRQYVEGTITIEQAYDSLLKICKFPTYNRYIILLAYGIVAGFSTIFLGGDMNDFFASFIVGLFLGILNIYLNKFAMTRFLKDVAGGCIIALTSILLTDFIPLGHNNNFIITGALMPLVPGIAITSAVRDTIEGDLLSGISRGIEAFYIAVSIAVGVGTTLKVYNLLMGTSYI